MDQPKLNQKKLNSICVSGPSREGNNRIVENVLSVKRHKTILTTNYLQKLESLQELKKFLLEKAFLGALTQKEIVV